MTTYTYKPLVGITSITDPRGETTKYVYDDFGRLKYIKDRDNNILKRYSYHYYNQPVTEDFNVELYTVTASTNGYGTVTISPEKVKKGSSATVNITPYTGYKISSITVDNQPQSISSSFTIYNVQKDIPVNVQFAIKTYSVTQAIDGGSGSVTLSPTTVNYGGSTTVTLYPGSGYMVDYVKVGTTTYPVSNNHATITNITSNITVHVKFKPQVTLSVNPGSLSFDFVDVSKTVTVTASGSWTATASASWMFIIPNSGSGNGTFSVGVLKNNSSARSGVITVSSGGNTTIVSVHQNAGLGGFK
jgi:YD repeat-containing protein